MYFYKDIFSFAIKIFFLYTIKINGLDTMQPLQKIL